MASPELQKIMDQLRAFPSPVGLSPAQRRAGFEAFASFPLESDVECSLAMAATVRAEWIRPPNVSRDAAILYLHGGGYMIGSINTHRALIARIARASGLQALAVDYRLAPECPFPAALEDAFAAYSWLIAQGTPPSRVVLAGDSAGGGLTVATLVRLRDARVPLPAAAVCLSPWVDLEATGESMTLNADRDPMIEKNDLLRFAAAYLGSADRRTPLAAPLYADLRGLPPMLIQVGEAETLYDDSVRLAERARRAGISVTFESWPEMIHVWQLFASMLPEGRAAIDDIGTFIRAHVGGLS